MENGMSEEFISIEDFLRKISLPRRYYKETFVISEKYEEEKVEFFKNYDKCCGKEFEKAQQSKVEKIFLDIHSSIKQNFEIIEEIFRYHENANPGCAQSAFDLLMKGMEEDMFISSIDDWTEIEIEGEKRYTKFRITPSNRFFRVRAVDSQSSAIEKNANELFHIPLSKRANASNGRFSLAGFPCLYLATMLPLAWQESGYPDKYYYSEFRYEPMYNINGQRDRMKELKFVSLYSPTEILWWGTAMKYNHFDTWLQVIKKYLITYPLTLACAFVNSSGNSPYKQEYIIPQMLMQWVQRNIDFVQGVSYFTCLDLSSFSNVWCAYNLALPALPPQDEEKYSLMLKECFNWSRPVYYSIPIIDKKNNVKDQLVIEELKNDITNALNTFEFIDPLHEPLKQMWEVLGDVQSVLDKSQGVDMQLLLHIISSLRRNHANICKINLIELLKGAESKSDARSAENLEKQKSLFKQIFDKFVGRRNPDEVGYILDKCKETIWNSLGINNEVAILFSKDHLVGDIGKWLRNNHILYSFRKLNQDNDTVDFLKSIALENEMTLDDFWEIPIGDDNWIKENICEIKQPIFIRYNNQNMFTPVDTKFREYICCGFDETVLKEHLQI